MSGAVVCRFACHEWARQTLIIRFEITTMANSGSPTENNKLLKRLSGLLYYSRRSGVADKRTHLIHSQLLFVDATRREKITLQLMIHYLTNRCLISVIRRLSLLPLLLFIFLFLLLFPVIKFFQVCLYIHSFCKTYEQFHLADTTISAYRKLRKSILFFLYDTSL